MSHTRTPKRLVSVSDISISRNDTFGVITLGQPESPTTKITINGDDITSLAFAKQYANEYVSDKIAELRASIEADASLAEMKTKEVEASRLALVNLMSSISALNAAGVTDQLDRLSESARWMETSVLQNEARIADIAQVNQEREREINKLNKKNKSRGNERARTAKKTYQQMAKLGLGQGVVGREDGQLGLSNQRYQSICFHHEDLSGLYVFPWVTDKTSMLSGGSNNTQVAGKKGKKAKISAEGVEAPAERVKFDEFVLANCLFGASILGVDANGKKYPMIDHNLEVDSPIEKIEVDNSRLHPYEIMMFASFDKLSALMHYAAVEDFVVRYHLPVVDYMLYGLHSYIIGVMSFDAFDKYIKAVKERGRIHENILTALAQKNRLNLHIESPFDNFSHDIDDMSAKKLLGIIRLDDLQLTEFKEGVKETERGEKRLNQLQNNFRHQQKDLCDFKDLIDTLATLDDFDDNAPMEVASSKVFSDSAGVSKGYTPPTYEIRMLLERLCIENILKHLRGNVSPVADGQQIYRSKTHAAIWNEIRDKEIVTSYSPLSKLFQVANTTLLVPQGKVRTCSLLPIDEKPIPESYKQKLAEHFGHITCLSWLPPINNCQNSPNDFAKNRSNYINNLFRLRLDLFRVDEDVLREQMTSAMGLEPSFWSVLDEAFVAVSRKVESDEVDTDSLTTSEGIQSDRENSEEGQSKGLYALCAELESGKEEGLDSNNTGISGREPVVELLLPKFSNEPGRVIETNKGKGENSKIFRSESCPPERTECVNSERYDPGVLFVSSGAALFKDLRQLQGACFKLQQDQGNGSGVTACSLDMGAKLLC